MTAKLRQRRARREFLQLTATGLALAALPFSARAQAKPKLGFVGSGRIGSTLGSLWHKAGHEVMFSSLDLENDRKLAAGLGAGAHAGSSREAVAFGDVAVFAVPYAALPKLGKDLAELLKGKVVLDTCNPIVARDGEIATWARDKGAGLASAELLPGARIVRAFNAVGFGRLAEAGARKTGMPIAGDDAGALEVVSRLVSELGFEPVVVGGLAMGRHLIPGTPLAGEHSAAEIREIAATLK